jgi:hypothetical protein
MLNAPAGIGESLITEIPAIALPAGPWERRKPKDISPKGIRY